MGIVAISHACSHLQNAAKARLGLTSLPSNRWNLNLALALHRAGFVSSVTRAGPRPPPPEALYTFEWEPVTNANVATRRLWLGLKYWNEEPVMKRLIAVSKPTRRITMSLTDLGRVVRGFHTRSVEGLNLGECLFVNTDLGMLEAREAIERRVGGVVLCRVS